MVRIITIGLASIFLAAGLSAHHGYGLFFDLAKQVNLNGRVTQILYKEPHILLDIETPDAGMWVAEWTSPTSVERQGVKPETIKPGDYLEIQGSPALKPENKVVSALRAIRRPADGWRWTRN